MFTLCHITDEFRQSVCKSYNTSYQLLQQDVETLKEWIRKQPHLPQSISDSMLTTFMVTAKGSLERAKEKMEKFYTTRLDMPEFIRDRDPKDERFRLASEETMTFPWPTLTSEGYMIFMIKFATGDPSKFDPEPVGMAMVAFLDLLAELESFVMGTYIVLDLSLISFSHLQRMTPSFALKIVRLMQDMILGKVKNIIVLNAPSFIGLLLNVFRPFIKAKLMDRIVINSGGADVLEGYVPKKCFPSDYGGEEDSCEILNKKKMEFILEHRDWLMSQGYVRVDESKRIGGSYYGKELGLPNMTGSFKTLCID